MNRLLLSFPSIAALRAVIGLTQGIALYGLFEARHQKVWPGDRPEILWPLLTVALFTPLLAIIGIGNLRWRQFAVWMVAAALLCAGLAYHAAAQGYWEAKWPFWA